MEDLLQFDLSFVIVLCFFCCSLLVLLFLKFNVCWFVLSS
jgi:hypothetical protein